MKLEKKIEGLLFVFGEEGVELDKICEYCGENQETIIKAIENFNSELLSRDSAIVISKIGKKYFFKTTNEMASFFELIFGDDQKEILSNAAMEVLAILAYKRECTRPEIEKIRGVASSNILYKLIAANLIVELRKDKEKGNAIVYGVSEDFLKHFSLTSLDELPELKDFDIESLSDEEVNLFSKKFEDINLDVGKSNE